MAPAETARRTLNALRILNDTVPASQALQEYHRKNQ